MRELVCPVGNPCTCPSLPLHLLWTLQQGIERHILPNGLHHIDTRFSLPLSAADCPCSSQLSRSRVAHCSGCSYCPVLCWAAEHPCHCRLEDVLPLWQSSCWKSPNRFWKKEIIDQKSLVTSGRAPLIPVFGERRSKGWTSSSPYSRRCLILPDPIQPNAIQCHPMVYVWPWLEIL